MWRLRMWCLRIIDVTFGLTIIMITFTGLLLLFTIYVHFIVHEPLQPRPQPAAPANENKQQITRDVENGILKHKHVEHDNIT